MTDRYGVLILCADEAEQKDCLAWLEARHAAGAIPTHDELREALAALCHEQWTGWMHYLFSKSPTNAIGQRTIPREWVSRWQRQMDTPYAQLSEPEKNSDREEADRVLSLLPDRSEAQLVALPSADRAS